MGEYIKKEPQKPHKIRLRDSESLSKGKGGITVLEVDGVTSSGKLKTSGIVKIDDYWYKVETEKDGGDGYTATPDKEKNSK